MARRRTAQDLVPHTFRLPADLRLVARDILLHLCVMVLELFQKVVVQLLGTTVHMVVLIGLSLFYLHLLIQHLFVIQLRVDSVLALVFMHALIDIDLLRELLSADESLATDVARHSRYSS
jgi:hypothetical protein